MGEGRRGPELNPGYDSLNQREAVAMGEPRRDEGDTQVGYRKVLQVVTQNFSYSLFLLGIQPCYEQVTLPSINL